MKIESFLYCLTVKKKQLNTFLVIIYMMQTHAEKGRMRCSGCCNVFIYREDEKTRILRINLAIILEECDSVKDSFL